MTRDSKISVSMEDDLVQIEFYPPAGGKIKVIITPEAAADLQRAIGLIISDTDFAVDPGSVRVN